MSAGISETRLAGAAEYVFKTTAHACRNALCGDESGEHLAELVKCAHQVADEAIELSIASSPASQKPACRVECTACCHLHVVATAPEVVAIAEHVQRHFEPEARARLTDRIESHVEATQGLNAETRRLRRPPCPLLVDGRCSVYSVRPLPCRGWNSLDRSLCDADLADPSRGIKAQLNLPQYVLAGRVSEGIAAACRSLVLEWRRLDLVRGLRTALAQPMETARAWRSGGDIFQDAVNDMAFPGPADPDDERARARLWESLGDWTRR